MVNAYRSTRFSFHLLLQAASIRSLVFIASGRFYTSAHTISCNPHNQARGFSTWPLNPDRLGSNPRAAVSYLGKRQAAVPRWGSLFTCVTFGP